MPLRAQNPVLICVDLQLGFLEDSHWGDNRNNRNAEAICGQIIDEWRRTDMKLIHVRHSSTDPQSPLHNSAPGFAFNPLCAPIDGERVLTKSVNSCFIGTDLKAILDAANCRTVVIIGLTTDHCVSTTTRMAGNYGYDTFLVSDATATFDKTGIDGEVYDAALVHATALASLKDEFATIITAEVLLASL